MTLKGLMLYVFICMYMCEEQHKGNIQENCLTGSCGEMCEIFVKFIAVPNSVIIFYPSEFLFFFCLVAPLISMILCVLSYTQ